MIELFRRYVTPFIAVVLLIFGSQSCQQQKLLSDRELAQVFHDAYLANAYTGSSGISLDSLRLYEPIFQKYGYSTEDVQYSIGSFATRKSARLSDVVEAAITMLERSGKLLDLEVAILDTIDNVSVRNTRRLIYERDLLSMSSVRDTVDMTIVLDSLAAATYEVSYDYLIDSLDKTQGSYIMKVWAVDTLERNRRQNLRNMVMIRNNIRNNNSVIVLPDSCERLVIRIEPPLKSAEKGVSMKVKNLVVNQILDTDEARDSLYRRMLDIKIFDDEILFASKTDSL